MRADHRTRPRRIALALAAVVIAGLGLTGVAASQPLTQPVAEAQQEQTLTWTADNSTTAYATAPTTAVAGATTIVFENTEETGNTSGMHHTLTFDTSTPGYNHDVDIDFMAYPDDENGGIWTAEVVLAEGVYRFYCTIPGHGQMQGTLEVTGNGGGGDTTPPTVTATLDGETDENGAYVGAATATLTATDDDSGVATVEYALDGGDWTAYSEPVEVTAVGDHTLAYRATDNEGNVSEPGEETFTVVEGSGGEDTTPPQVELMLHGDTNADGAYLGAAEVMISATDGNSGVASIEYTLDGGDWTAYTDPFEVTELGEHTVGYRATDNAGNVSEPGTQEFTVVQGTGDDTEPPVVTAAVTGELNSAWEFVGTATVTVTATDEGSGVETVEYRLDDGDWTAYEEPVAIEDEGEHTVAYRATDAAGNVSEEASSAFTVVGESSGPACAHPDPSPTVVVGTVGTGVRNRVVDGSCTVDDLILDEARWATHPAFVTHVQDVTADLVTDGYLTTAERNKIVTAARQSDVGRTD